MPAVLCLNLSCRSNCNEAFMLIILQSVTIWYHLMWSCMFYVCVVFLLLFPRCLVIAGFTEQKLFLSNFLKMKLSSASGQQSWVLNLAKHSLVMLLFNLSVKRTERRTSRRTHWSAKLTQTTFHGLLEWITMCYVIQQLCCVLSSFYLHKAITLCHPH